ncbi:MAG: ABC transporter substrate-binding protein [Clostridiales bacterium]|jgi:NitT/TauT family transport system substrate-binding protein|nr:ABC transporter substrate-binding protein [Clostridiales bacterium]
MKKILLLALFIFFAGCSRTETEDAPIRVAAIRGPTAMGLLPLMNEGVHEFELLGSPDLVPPLLVQNSVDIAVVPGNLASILYNRMNNVQAFAVVTLGVLHVVDASDTIYLIEDLAGRTIFLQGPGATPEYALNYVLTQNGLIPGEDVFLEFRSEHSEIAAMIQTGHAEIALLPEPFVSTVLSQINGTRAALDLTQEWNRVQPDYGLIMSVAVARRDFVEQNPDALAAFMEEYAASVAFVNSNIAETAQLAVDFELIPNIAIAEAAIPRANIVFITGEEMRQNLLGFYGVLLEAEPESIGGELPEENFFFRN